MDPQRFDAFARSLSGLRSRRQVARGLVAGLLTGTTLGNAPDEAAARVCREAGERCNDRTPCCGPGTVCRDGVCVCGQGYARCNGVCRNLQTDEANRGVCGRACPDDGACCNGVCCGRYETCCGGQCVDLDYSDANCGGCGQDCPAGLRCRGSRCRDLSNDPTRCGSCFSDCTTGGACANGQCICPAATDCGSANRRGYPPGAKCCRGRDCFSTLCCSASCDAVTGLCSPCAGSRCDEDEECCGNLSCTFVNEPGGRRVGYCGGCLDRASACVPGKSTCCTTGCTRDPKTKEHLCLSRVDGPCQRDVDCASCFFGKKKCKGSCRDGRCAR